MLIQRTIGREGQSKGHRSSEGGPPHDNLVPVGDLVGGPSVVHVDEGGDGEHGGGAGDEAGEDGDEAEAEAEAEGEGEHGEPQVDEDGGLAPESDDVEELDAEMVDLVVHVGGGVVGHGEAREEDADDAGEVQGLREQVGGVGEERKQQDLQRRVAAKVGAVLEQQRGHQAHQHAEADGAAEDVEEPEGGQGDGEAREGGVLEGDDGLVKDDGHGVVESRLAKDDAVEARVDTEGIEDGEHRHGVGGGDEGAEDQRLNEGERVRVIRHEAVEIDDAAEDEGGDGGAQKGEQQHALGVHEEVPPLQAEPALEDDGRQQVEEEDQIG